MSVLVLLTFLTTNMQALLWQQSSWLVSTVLPAVVVDLTNQERSDVAAPPLRRNPVLDLAAQKKAEHMAANEYFAHYSPDGLSPWVFFREAGYVYAHAGENLAIHFTDSSEMVAAWMNSPAHRENIVNNAFQEIGVGTAKGTYEGFETVYVVQLFGTPAIPPVTVVEEVEKIAVIPAVTAVESVPRLQPAPATVAGTQNSPSGAEYTSSEKVLADTQNTSSPASLVELGTLEPVLVTAPITPEPVSIDAVAVHTAFISTSSGLAVAPLEHTHATHAGATAAIATQPNRLLENMYILLAFATFTLIMWSIFHEARRLHMIQVAYSVALLFVMGGLWYLHNLLTVGAVVV